jgi:HEPN domain-containing protein
MMSASNTTRLVRHLLAKHQIQSRKPTALIEEEEKEKEEDEDTTQAISIARSVLQQQLDGAHQRPA